MTAEKLDFHPYANLFPMMGGRELEEFQWDIRQNGVREPVILFEGKILDGRNRYKAATALGKEVRFEQYQGDDALAFVISLNLHRRHMTASQRAMVAAKLHSLTKVEAQKKKDIRSRWVASARASFDPGDRQPCVICNGYASVSHAHHVTPLYRQPTGSFPDHRHVWLCPTHHSGVHLILDSNFAWPSLDGFSEKEKDAMTEVAARGVKNAN